MNKRIVLILIGLVLAVSLLVPTNAVPKLLVDVIPVDDEVPYNEVAEYVVELTNNQDISESVRIPAPRNAWDITIKPYALDLAPHESQNVSIRISPPQEIKSGIYSLYFEFTLENSSEKVYTWINTEITESSPVVEAKVSIIRDLEIKEQFAEEFLKKMYTVTITNNGNVDASDVWSTDVSVTDSFFLDANPAYAELVDSEEHKVLSWNYALAPGESKQFTYSVSYLPLFVAFIVLVIALIMLAVYYISKYKVTKEIVVSKTKDDDSFVKIKLSVKNKTNQLQNNVTLEDYVPVPFGLSREFGTIKPDAIKKSKSKLTLTWKFEELLPKEERIVSYKMKSTMEIVGKITIPPACIKQKNGKKSIQVFSKIFTKDRF
jgi:hypothetical protein